MSNIKRELQAKTFYANHSIGENILSKWEAKPLDNDAYLITRHDGSTRRVVIGENIPKVGEVSVNSAGNLSVGTFTVIVGENLIPDWEAKPTKGKDTFKIRRPAADGETFDVQLGEEIAGLGKAVKDAYGNLRFGDKSVRVARKQFEINLLVWNVQDDKNEGFQSVINLIQSGNKANRKDGVYGTFKRTHMDSGKPAVFQEKGPNGEPLNTAVFFASENKRFLHGKIRDRDKAMLHREAFLNEMRLERRIKQECRETGLKMEEHMDYPDLVRAAEIKEDLNKNSWTHHHFTVTKGAHLFGLKADPVKNNVPEYSR